MPNALERFVAGGDGSSRLAGEVRYVLAAIIITFGQTAPILWQFPQTSFQPSERGFQFGAQPFAPPCPFFGQFAVEQRAPF
ncbi:MAG TPA: hypothetical protein DCE44_05030 [Verrucomicrobiales bacterium]|nr:hypothetical protein [Verrucomicrobiales bacterium]